MQFPAPGSKALRRGRASLAGQVYLVTTRTHDRQPLFADLWAGRAVVHVMRRLDETRLATTLAYVVMPDHLHWLVELDTGHLHEAVRLLKGRSARDINQRRREAGRVWQPGFHDHALRRDEGVVNAARYIIANPLRAGLVERAGNYPLWDCVWV